jgi:hypothetical protein
VESTTLTLTVTAQAETLDELGDALESVAASLRDGCTSGGCNADGATFDVVEDDA